MQTLNRYTGYIFISFCLIFSTAAWAVAPMKLFGVPLKDSTRTKLRKAISKAGLVPLRVNNNYFCDKYAVSGQLRGAKTFYACYTENRNHVAHVEYIFPAFMDTQLVSRVINLVKNKYGTPSSVTGDTGLGAVTALWNRDDGMRIKVSRGWPDTTTTLDIIDVANDRLMKSQIEHDKKVTAKKQAQHDVNAF